MYIPDDIQYVILNFLSLVHDYNSFDDGLLQRRRIHANENKEDLVLFALLAVEKGHFQKLKYVWKWLPVDDWRWILYSASAFHQMEIVDFVWRTIPITDHIRKGRQYWANRAETSQK